MGLKFQLEPNYFEKRSNGQNSAFENHIIIVEKAFNKFDLILKKEAYVKTFSVLNWMSLSTLEKESHSLSNCVICASKFYEIQRTFLLKSFFEISKADHEKENVSSKVTSLQHN